eukprot:557953-Pyramimonas_sp.AAC.1
MPARHLRTESNPWARQTRPTDLETRRHLNIHCWAIGMRSVDGGGSSPIPSDGSVGQSGRSVTDGAGGAAGAGAAT